MGKSLPDARAEMKRTVQNIEAACSMPIVQHGDKMIGSASGIDGEVIRLPIGVFGAITPLTFFFSAFFRKELDSEDTAFAGNRSIERAVKGLCQDHILLFGDNMVAVNEIEIISGLHASEEGPFFFD